MIRFIKDMGFLFLLFMLCVGLPFLAFWLKWEFIGSVLGDAL